VLVTDLLAVLDHMDERYGMPPPQVVVALDPLDEFSRLDGRLIEASLLRKCDELPRGRMSRSPWNLATAIL
jgi:hypothetical protein